MLFSPPQTRKVISQLNSNGVGKEKREGEGERTERVGLRVS